MQTASLTGDGQSATDRPLALTEKKRAEVILIDNPNTEFNEAERQRILVAKAREVASERDTLLWVCASGYTPVSIYRSCI